jgi:cytochrome c oxidase subunit II
MIRTTKPLLGAIMMAAVLTSSRTVATEDAVHEVHIVASKYQFEPAQIQVAAGESLRLVIRSNDGTHGFAIPTLKIDEHIPKNGDAVTVALVAPPAGRYEIACSEFCGSGHGQMKAALVSVGPTRTH